MNILIKDLKYRRTGNGNGGRQTDQEKKMDGKYI